MSNGIDKNPLLDISKVYVQQVVEKKKDDTYLEPDMKKRQANNEKARKDMEKIPGQKNPHFEEKQLDPVGQEDADIDNDGDTDKSDKYLHKRRKAIAKAMKKKMSEGVRDMNPEKGTAERKARLEKKRGMKMDDHPQYKKEEVEEVAEGDGDPCWDTHKQVGMKKKGNRMVPNCVPKVKAESFSNWRSELTEVAPMKDEEEKEIKEKKVNNKIIINPKLGEEAISELGGTLIEMVEYDEFDGMVEGVYFELQEEGYAEGDIEEALEWVLTEAKVTYGHDTESPRQQMMKKAKGRLKFMKRKAGEALSSAKKKAGEKITSVKKDAAQAQVDAYNKGRELKQKAGDKVRGAKTGIKAKIKRVAQKVVDRMSEEAEVDPKEKQMLAKKKTMMMKQQMLDKQRMQMQQQGKLPSGHRVEQKEEMSIKDQMRISREANAKRKPYQPGDHQKARAAVLKNAAKNAKKDTRTDAEKMADATGPRDAFGRPAKSGYRGD